ncbi:head GIN domain-containing protein [uncultured Alistipes sp.]|jgi:hypothetical protein|uniref:head GIN domain-containing protein n=1 Tax=uncultured Alistipes sp. TaxID=538949 RepID=UPI0025E9D03A|nr:head GIN domain-containing protein [uncultured Alistipes sp.]
MKKFLQIALICAIFTPFTCFTADAATTASYAKKIKGSDKIISRTIKAPAFDRIDASRAVKVVISDETKDQILIEANDNVMDYVVVEAKSGELTITLHKDIKEVSNLDVTVTVPANGRIRSIDASSAASVTGDVVLTADKFALIASSAAKIRVAVESTSCNIETSSAAKIDADITTENCRIEASSSSSITLRGLSDSCDVDMSSAAKLAAENFIVNYYTVDTSSAAKASVNCIGRLKADASSGSRISYTGNCDTSIDRSSGGKVGRD